MLRGFCGSDLTGCSSAFRTRLCRRHIRHSTAALFHTGRCAPRRTHCGNWPRCAAYESTVHARLPTSTTRPAEDQHNNELCKACAHSPAHGSRRLRLRALQQLSLRPSAYAPSHASRCRLAARTRHADLSIGARLPRAPGHYSTLRRYNSAVPKSPTKTRCSG